MRVSSGTDYLCEARKTLITGVCSQCPIGIGQGWFQRLKMAYNRPFFRYRIKCLVETIKPVIVMFNRRLVSGLINEQIVSIFDFKSNSVSPTNLNYIDTLII
jgi:hypothetical protein